MLGDEKIARVAGQQPDYLGWVISKGTTASGLGLHLQQVGCSLGSPARPSRPTNSDDQRERPVVAHLVLQTGWYQHKTFSQRG